ncbi:MAG: orotate phosphoribosyltransferase [Thermoanaerobaculia bacterium]|nr:orotate phosphoribosyltransferase [Thermoanaerobaculia bacterium]
MGPDPPSERERLKTILAERSYQRRRVVLASGRESDFYFDSKQTVLDAEGAYLAGRLFFEAIEELTEYPLVRAVGGLELGSVPIGAAISVVSHLAGRPLAHLVIRKKAKEHGTGAAIEGEKLIEPGATVVVVEDVVTTGGSSLAAARRLREAGFEVKSLVTLIDRQEGGREAIEAEGLRLVSLFTRSDFT